VWQGESEWPVQRWQTDRSLTDQCANDSGFTQVTWPGRQLEWTVLALSACRLSRGANEVAEWNCANRESPPPTDLLTVTGQRPCTAQLRTLMMIDGGHKTYTTRLHLAPTVGRLKPETYGYKPCRPTCLQMKDASRRRSRRYCGQLQWRIYDFVRMGQTARHWSQKRSSYTPIGKKLKVSRGDGVVRPDATSPGGLKVFVLYSYTKILFQLIFETILFWCSSPHASQGLGRCCFNS